MARKITIEKLTDNPNPYFSKGMLGEYTMYVGPSVGERFKAYRGMDTGIRTTEVKNIQFVSENVLRIKTLNSEYEITVGEEIA